MAEPPGDSRRSSRASTAAASGSKRPAASRTSGSRKVAKYDADYESDEMELESDDDDVESDDYAGEIESDEYAGEIKSPKGKLVSSGLQSAMCSNLPSPLELSDHYAPIPCSTFRNSSYLRTNMLLYHPYLMPPITLLTQVSPLVSRRTRSSIKSSSAKSMFRSSAPKLQQLGETDEKGTRKSLGPTASNIAKGMSQLASADRSTSEGIKRLNQDRFPAEVESSEELSNMATWLKAWEKLKILREVHPPAEAGPLPVGSLLASPEVAPARWVASTSKGHTARRPQHITKKGKVLELTLTNGTKKTTLRCADSLCDREELEACVPTIVGMVRRLPDQAVLDAKAKGEKTLILRTALQHHSVRTFFNMPSIRFVTQSNCESYRTMVEFWTLDGQRLTTPITLNPANVDPNTPIPTIACTLAFPTQREDGAENFIPPIKTRKFDEPKYRKTLEILKYIVFQCHTRVFASAIAMKAYTQDLINTFVSKVTKRGNRDRGAFDGSSIYRTMHQMSPTGPKTLVVFSKAVEKTVSGPLIEYHGSMYNHVKPKIPVVEVNSHAFTRVGPVLEALTNSFWADLGLEEMIKTGCRIADAVNSLIGNEDPPNVDCACDEQLAMTMKHTCNRCGFLATCNQLKFSDVALARLCLPCTEKVGTTKDEQERAQRDWPTF